MRSRWHPHYGWSRAYPGTSRPVPHTHPPRPQPPELPPEEVQAARDRADLQEALAWGFCAGNPDTLMTAIQRLRAAAQPDPLEVYRDRSAHHAERDRRDMANLARRLAEIQQRGAHLQSQPERLSVDINNAFPSNFLKADDLQGRAAKVVIASCEMEDLGEGDHKPVVRFRDKDKGLVLNRTNAATIAAEYGSNTDSWTGRELEIYPDRTMFQGRMVACLRVRVPAPPPPTSGAADADIPW